MLREELERASKRDVSRETTAAVEYFMRTLAEENARQNLISPASIPNLINRHILDSAQLLSFVADPRRSWIDIGTGPGLPGLIIALINDGPVTLVEPRKLRISFLQRMVSELSLSGRVTIIAGKAAAAQGAHDVITGRAVAALPKFFALASHLATKSTLWVLPKGRSAKSELEEARKLWQGSFHLEPSMTDAEASIIIARQVQRRGKR